MLQMLWIDKYRPHDLKDLYYPEISATLSDLAQTNDFPHMIFYGPEGAGKKTRVLNFIQQVYGTSSLILNQQTRTFKIQNPNKVIEYNAISSNYHIQITPADNQYDDRHIVQKVVKDIASSKQVNQKSSRKFKILVINQADRLSKDAQGSLRRTMEKYMQSCRMILICKNIHRLITPIRSRCVNLRIPAPTNQIIQQILTTISKRQFAEMSHELIVKIVKMSKRNLRDAISQLECCKFAKKVDGQILHPFKIQVQQIAKLIISQQSPAQLLKVRSHFYDILINCVEPNIILKQLLEQIIDRNSLRDQVIKQLIHKATEIQKTLVQGSKAIVHLECFAAHAMEIILQMKESI